MGCAMMVERIAAASDTVGGGATGLTSLAELTRGRLGCRPRP